MNPLLFLEVLAELQALRAEKENLKEQLAETGAELDNTIASHKRQIGDFLEASFNYKVEIERLREALDTIAEWQYFEMGTKPIDQIQELARAALTPEADDGR